MLRYYIWCDFVHRVVFFFQAEDGIRDIGVTGVQTCALPISGGISGGSLFFFLQNVALEITQASNVSFIICTAPLLTTGLSMLFYRSEKRSEEHTSELQSRQYLVCRLLLEKKKTLIQIT